MLKTLSQIAAKKNRPDTVYVAKKRNKYLGHNNGELALTTKQGQAIAFEDSDDLDCFIDQACIDTRNAHVVGKSYGICPVYLKGE